MINNQERVGEESKMMEKIKNVLIYLLKFAGIWEYGVKSYSQEGEDLILRRYFETQEMGFYIDVGAHHPFRFSNTYLFYKMGWWGINIDAMPDSMRLFNRYRKRDINIECGVSDKTNILEYYEFDDPALNGFNKDISLERNENTGYKIQRIVKVNVKTLSDILNEYKFLSKQKISFLTIDAEGFDFKVLKSIDLNKFSPKLILIEDNKKDKNEKNGNYLKKFGYYFYAKTVNTYFYEKR